MNYYTLLVEGRTQSETDSFFSRFEQDTQLADDINLLVTWMAEIGQRRGTISAIQVRE